MFLKVAQALQCLRYPLPSIYLSISLPLVYIPVVFQSTSPQPPLPTPLMFRLQFFFYLLRAVLCQGGGGERTRNE